MENKMNREVSLPFPGPADRVRIMSWASVFAGVVIALVLQLLLSLLGVAIGMSTIDPLSETRPLEGVGTGALVWWIISTLVSLFTGGWVAGRWTGVRLHRGGFHGLLTWAVFTLLSLFLVTSMVGNIIGGVGGAVGKTLAFAGQTAAQVAPEATRGIKEKMREEGISGEDIRQEARELLQQSANDQGPKQMYSENRSTTTGGSSEQPAGQQADERINRTIDSLFGSKGGEIADRESAINIIMTTTGKSREEAVAIVDSWSSNLRQMNTRAEEKAREVGEEAAEGMSKAAIYTFFALLLGAGTAFWGGWLAERQTRKRIQPEHVS